MMNRFVLGAIQVYSVFAQEQFPETYTQRVSEIGTYPMLATTVTAGYNNIQWNLKVSTVINEDTGDQLMRWYHELTANILATDKILFEVSFYAGADSEAPTRQRPEATDMAEDGG